MTAQAGSTISPSNQRPRRRSSAPTFAERSRLRREVRLKRQALTDDERARAERAIARQIRSLGAYRHARRLGIFFAFDGEPDLARLMQAAGRSGKTLHAPVLFKDDLRFRRIDAHTPLQPNFFGILEPRRGRPVDARSLDLVLTPLVAFDNRGVRLGVGRGYYDRAFEFLRNRGGWRKPKLLGIGYEFQRLAHIDSQPWDVPLWGAVTEAGVYRF